MEIIIYISLVILITWNSWAETLRKLLSLAIFLTVFCLVNMAQAAAKRIFVRELKKEEAMITQTALLIQREQRIERLADFQRESHNLLDRKRQNGLWRSVIAEEKVKLVSNEDLSRRPSAFFLDY